MSVFTSVNLQDLAIWLQNYNVGDVIEIKGISAGITNTNYFVSTNFQQLLPQQDVDAQSPLQVQQGINKFVLTLFEHNAVEELPYFIDLMSHLASHGIPCPRPIVDKHGQSLHVLKGKPAAMVSCLAGRDIGFPKAKHCAEVGRVMANMHLVGLSFDQQPHHYVNQNPRGADWRLKTAAHVMSYLSGEDRTLLNDTMAFQQQLDLSTLPIGVIHADLFRDNVLFVGDTVGGLIDFYYACHDALAYDLAIAVNDWCVETTGELNIERTNAMLNAYQRVRPFTIDEKQLWPSLLKIAALRFWLSRLYDQIFPQTGELTHAKDPNHFKRILKLRRQML